MKDIIGLVTLVHVKYQYVQNLEMKCIARRKRNYNETCVIYFVTQEVVQKIVEIAECFG